jgi:hypothetical protein
VHIKADKKGTSSHIAMQLSLFFILTGLLSNTFGSTVICIVSKLATGKTLDLFMSLPFFASLGSKTFLICSVSFPLEALFVSSILVANVDPVPLKLALGTFTI